MQARLLRHASRSVDHATAEDLVLLTLETLWGKQLPEAVDEVEQSRLRSLGYRVLDGHLRNELRSRRRESRLLGQVIENQMTRCGDEPDVAVVVIPDGLTPTTHAAIASLNTADREVLVLMVEGFRVSEMAEILELSPGAVSMRLLRAKGNLRRRINDDRARRLAT